MADAPTQLTLHYRTQAAFARDAKAQFATGYLYVVRDLDRPMLAPVAVTVHAPDGTDFVVDGEIIQRMAGTSVVVQVKASGKAAIAAASAHVATLTADALGEGADPLVLLEGEEAPSGAAADDGDSDDDDTGADVAAEDDPALKTALSDGEKSLQAQLEAMTIAEKRAAAVHGSREMRWLIMRDQNKSLHPFVLKNHGIQIDEIELMARMTSINPNCLHEMAANRDWVRSTNVVRALVRNPKTAVPDAVKLIEKHLPVTECQALSKMGSLRMPILMAARKKMRG